MGPDRDVYIFSWKVQEILLSMFSDPLEHGGSIIGENVHRTLLAIFSYHSTTPTGQLLHTGQVYSIGHLQFDRERNAI